MCRRDPSGNRVPRLLSQLKLSRRLGLLLHDNLMASDQIAAAQLAVDGKIDSGKFSGSRVPLPSNSDDPDRSQIRWRLRAQ
jgi:hypothetical protein